MSKKMMAYCGIICSDCMSMVATLKDDQEELEIAAEFSRQEWNVLDATWKNIHCEGCKGVRRLPDICISCPIRSCAISKGVDNCAECEKYLGCEKLHGVHRDVPEAKNRLDTIYTRLNAY